jgi:acyl-CoA thioesterase FadM
MTSVFTKDYAVRFGEIDHAGVMYYPAIFDRIHKAFEDFWPEVLGKTYAQVLGEDGVGFPLIDTKSPFRRPFRFGETRQVSIAVEAIGTKSVTFLVELRAQGDDRVRAQARMVNAVIAMETFRPVPLPAAHAAALAPYLVEPDA